MRIGWTVFLLVGCGLATTDTGGTGTPTGDTGTTATSSGSTADTSTTRTTNTPVVNEAWCKPSSNALRFDCGVELSGPAEVTLMLTAKGAPTRTFVSAMASEHSISGWGLLPETEYVWSLADDTGTLSTGALPANFASANLSTTGTAAGFDAVLRPLQCGNSGYFTMIDGDGRIIWYEPNAVYFQGRMTGYEWSQEHRTVLSAGAGAFQEQHVSGEEVLYLDDSDYDYILHHDTDRWGDYRYLLFERGVGSVNVDGIHVHDGEKIVATWFMEEAFEVSGGQGDWGHSNGLNVTEDGVIVLSVLNFNTVLGIDGDPASDTFLEVLWQAGGQATGGLPGIDYRPIAGATEGFRGQHNASRVGDDLYVFDNLGQSNSRALRMAMDHKAGSLTVTGSWLFGTTCRNQGGALPVPGGMLATCANAGQVWLFDEKSTSPVWTLSGTCGAGGNLTLTRAIPIRVE